MKYYPGQEAEELRGAGLHEEADTVEAEEAKLTADDNGDACEVCGCTGEVASYYSRGRYRSLCEECANP